MSISRKDLRFSRRPKRQFLIGALILSAVFFAANKYIPSQHLPWRSLNPNAPVGLSTSLHLIRVSLSPNSICEDIVSRATDFQSTPAVAKNSHDVCGWRNARSVSARSDTRLSPPDINMQCPLALGVHIWLGELNYTALRIFDSKIVEVHHAGSYSCRKQVGNSSGAWSEHAFANAWDITGFTLENGELISVLKDWDGQKDKKKFLRSARSKACKIFRVTLSPDYNEAHRDHFHLDMGPTTACR
ncbi:MAG: extensin family protein [Maricaulaceae bacterium]